MKSGMISVQLMTENNTNKAYKIAQEIVRLASPFEPFSDEMLSEYEVLQVDRIWKFGS